MTKASAKIRSILDAFASAEPGMSSFVAALPNHHGGGGLEWGAKAVAHGRHDDGEVRSEPEVLKALTAPLRTLLKDLGIDPKVSNPCIVAFRGEAGLSISLLVVSPGDVEQGRWASYESCTEKESFQIANGPQPHRYPYAKMPHPIGTVVGILADGSLGEPLRSLPPTGEWFYCPIEWTAVDGIPQDMVAPDPFSKAVEDMGKDRSGLRDDGREIDPFMTDAVLAMQMQPPGLRDIRRIGVPNGFRDGRGNAVE